MLETACEVLDTLCSQRALGFGERATLVRTHEELEELTLLHFGDGEAEAFQAVTLRHGALAVGVGAHLQVTPRGRGCRRLGATGARRAAGGGGAAGAGGGARRRSGRGRAIARLRFVAVHGGVDHAEGAVDLVRHAPRFRVGGVGPEEDDGEVALRAQQYGVTGALELLPEALRVLLVAEGAYRHAVGGLVGVGAGRYRSGPTRRGAGRAAAGSGGAGGAGRG